jgi:hypothetical protein
MIATPPAQPAPVREDWGPGPHEYHSLPAPTAQEPQRYSPDGEGGMEVDSLGAYVKLQDVTTPPAAQPAAQEFVCSTGLCHYKAVPDALTSADIQEHIEYVAGWNDCRQAMLEMMK